MRTKSLSSLTTPSIDENFDSYENNFLESLKFSQTNLESCALNESNDDFNIYEVEECNKYKENLKKLSFIDSAQNNLHPDLPTTNGLKNSPVKQLKFSKLISYPEALSEFRLKFDSVFKIQDNSAKNKTSISLFKSFFQLKNTENYQDLDNNKNFIIYLSRLKFDEFGCLNLRIIQTFYYIVISDHISKDNHHLSCKKLSGCSDLSYPNLDRKGDHWRRVGFEDRDAGSELNSSGVLLMLQLLLFSSRHPFLTRKIVEYSQAERGGFPFISLSIRLTVVCSMLLKRGKLDSLQTKKDSILEIFNNLYMALFCKFYEKYCLKQQMIHDMQKILKKLEYKATKRYKKLLKYYSNFNANTDVLIFL